MTLRIPLKMLMALLAAAAIAVGLMIPVANRPAAATSQVDMLELGRG